MAARFNLLCERQPEGRAVRRLAALRRRGQTLPRRCRTDGVREEGERKKVGHPQAWGRRRGGPEGSSSSLTRQVENCTLENRGQLEMAASPICDFLLLCYGAASAPRATIGHDILNLALKDSRIPALGQPDSGPALMSRSRSAFPLRGAEAGSLNGELQGGAGAGWRPGRRSRSGPGTEYPLYACRGYSRNLIQSPASS